LFLFYLFKNSKMKRAFDGARRGDRSADKPDDRHVLEQMSAISTTTTSKETSDLMRNNPESVIVVDLRATHPEYEPFDELYVLSVRAESASAPPLPPSCASWTLTVRPSNSSNSSQVDDDEIVLASSSFGGFDVGDMHEFFVRWPHAACVPKKGMAVRCASAVDASIFFTGTLASFTDKVGLPRLVHASSFASSSGSVSSSDSASCAPYMMNPDNEPLESMRAFVPLWKQCKTWQPHGLAEVVHAMRVLIDRYSKNASLPPTHVFLDSGKAHVRWEDVPRWHAGIAASLQSGHTCFVTELRTPFYREFVDFDLVQPEKLRASQIEELARTALVALRQFFPAKAADDPIFYAIVCSTGYKAKFASRIDEVKHARGLVAASKLTNTSLSAEEAAPYERMRRCGAAIIPIAWKTGVHVIYPNMYVNDAMALFMREAIIYTLRSAFGTRVTPCNDWEDVVDKSVYGGSGLRMIGNLKADKCPQCYSAKRVGRPTECSSCEDELKFACNIELHWPRVSASEFRKDAKAGVDCPTCGGVGRVNTGRPYMPMLVMDSLGVRRTELEEVYRRDFLRLVDDTSLRWRGVPWKTSNAASIRAQLCSDVLGATTAAVLARTAEGKDKDRDSSRGRDETKKSVTQQQLRAAVTHAAASACRLHLHEDLGDEAMIASCAAAHAAVADAAVELFSLDTRMTSEMATDAVMAKWDALAHVPSLPAPDETGDGSTSTASTAVTTDALFVYEQPPLQGWVLPAGALRPSDSVDAEVGFKAARRAPTPVSSSAGGAASSAALATATARALLAKSGRGMTVVLEGGDPLAAMLQEFIRVSAGGKYRDLVVDAAIRTNKERTIFWVNVRGRNQNYCGNIGGEHRSNRIFFEFSAAGMCTRCHKQGEPTPAMKYGACEKYRSSSVPLTPQLKVALFPKHVAKTASLLAKPRELPWDAAAADGDVRAQDSMNKSGSGKVSVVAMRLLEHGDRLSLQLFGRPWSSSVKCKDNTRIVSISNVAAFETRAALGASASVKPPSTAAFIGVDYSLLGQGARARDDDSRDHSTTTTHKHEQQQPVAFARDRDAIDKQATMIAHFVARTTDISALGQISSLCDAPTDDATRHTAATRVLHAFSKHVVAQRRARLVSVSRLASSASSAPSSSPAAAAASALLVPAPPRFRGLRIYKDESNLI
jgi:hypothetical protein